MTSSAPIIPAPPFLEEKPFKIRDTLTVFEAAMVYAARHPHGRFLRGASREDRLLFLKAGIERPRRPARLSWDVYCDMLNRIERGVIRPLRTAYTAKGEIDTVRTVLHIADLAQLAIERNERPKYLKHLLANQRNMRRRAPFTETMAQRFVSDFIKAERKAGRRPTMQSIEAAAGKENRHGGREFIRAAARRSLGSDVKRGRPKTKFANK